MLASTCLYSLYVYSSYCSAQKILTFRGFASASITSWEVGNGSLKVDDADKGHTSGPKEREQLLNHKPTKVLRVTRVPVASRKPDTWSLHQKLAAG